MTVQRYTYDVALVEDDGATVEHRITITAGDRLRAELEAGRHKIPKDAVQNNTAVMLWCGLTRTGVITTDWMTFQHTQLDEFDVVKGPDGKPITEAPDPTQPAGSSSSPSPSQPTTAAESSTGSTSMTES